MDKAATRIFTIIIAALILYVVQLGSGRDTVAESVTRVVQPSEHVASSASAPTVSTQNDATMYDVVRVVDGDTVVVSLTGKESTVRLIGLDTPETVDPRKPVQCFGEEASQEAHRLLDGQRVRLEMDSSQDSHDKYGRMLAYVFLQDGRMFNKYMIADGFGHEYTYRVPYKYQSEFKMAQQEARAAQKGLWAPDACTDYSP